MSNRRYTPEQREGALRLAAEIGTIAASKKLRIPDGTISSWRHAERKAAAKSAPAPASAAETLDCKSAVRMAVDAAAEQTKDNGRVAKFYSPSLKGREMRIGAARARWGRS